MQYIVLNIYKNFFTQRMERNNQKNFNKKTTSFLIQKQSRFTQIKLSTKY